MSVYFTKDHEWIRMEGDIAVVGITNYAQERLGDVVFVEVPDAGTRVAAELNSPQLRATTSARRLTCQHSTRIAHVRTPKLVAALDSRDVHRRNPCHRLVL